MCAYVSLHGYRFNLAGYTREVKYSTVLYTNKPQSCPLAVRLAAF